MNKNIEKLAVLLLFDVPISSRRSKIQPGFKLSTVIWNMHVAVVCTIQHHRHGKLMKLDREGSMFQWFSHRRPPLEVIPGEEDRQVEPCWVLLSPAFFLEGANYDVYVPMMRTDEGMHMGMCVHINVIQSM